MGDVVPFEHPVGRRAGHRPHLDEVLLEWKSSRVGSATRTGPAGAMVTCSTASHCSMSAGGSDSAVAATAPLHEALQAQVMRLYWRAGRRADALAKFDRTRRALREELGIGPGPQLLAAVRAILAEDALSGAGR